VVETVAVVAAATKAAVVAAATKVAAAAVGIDPSFSP
jgi:hypothetical protein